MKKISLRIFLVFIALFLVFVLKSNVKAFSFIHNDVNYDLPDLPEDSDNFNSSAFLIIKTSGNFNLNANGYTAITFIDYDPSTDFVHQGNKSGYWFVRNSNSDKSYYIRQWMIDSVDATSWYLFDWQPKTNDLSGNSGLSNYDNLVFSTVSVYTDDTKSEIFFPRVPLLHPIVAAKQGAMKTTLQEILNILPMILVVLVSCIGLRKALTMLSQVLHRA